MTSASSNPHLGHGLSPGDSHYRAYIGPPDKYDLVSAMQFNLLTALGLREGHFLLDIGCGSLRAGRLFVPYLLEGRYYGIEPEKWLLEEGIARELGEGILGLKRPTFRHADDFSLSAFGRKFDFIVAQSIFSHAAVGQIRRCLAEARQVMTPSSIFAATFAEGAGNYNGDDWVYPDCIHYTFAFFSSLAEEAGLRCQRLDWHHPNGQTWVAITLPTAPLLPDLADPNRCGELRRELDACREELKKTAAHPYVRIGLQVRNLLRNMGLLPRRDKS